MYEPVGALTRICRYVCSVLILAPLTYFYLVTDGDAYHFLILVVLAPIAATVLLVNCLFCLYRHRATNSLVITVAFMVLSTIGFYSAWFFLPQFGM